MTITVSIRVPQHCAAEVTTVANPKSDNPTESKQTYDPGTNVDLVVHDGQSLRIDEIAAPDIVRPDVDSRAADQSDRARGGAAPTPEAEEAQRQAEEAQDGGKDLDDL